MQGSDLENSRAGAGSQGALIGGVRPRHGALPLEFLMRRRPHFPHSLFLGASVLSAPCDSNETQ